MCDEQHHLDPLPWPPSFPHSFTTDPKKLSHPTQHQDVWDSDPTGENTFQWSDRKHHLLWPCVVTLSLCTFRSPDSSQVWWWKCWWRPPKPPASASNPTTWQFRQLARWRHSLSSQTAHSAPSLSSTWWVEQLAWWQDSAWSRKTLTPPHPYLSHITGHQCQLPSVRHWNEAGWSRHPQQVSYLKIRNCSQRRKMGAKGPCRDKHHGLILSHLHRLGLTLAKSYVGEFQVRDAYLTRVPVCTITSSSVN